MKRFNTIGKFNRVHMSRAPKAIFVTRVYRERIYFSLTAPRRREFIITDCSRGQSVVTIPIIADRLFQFHWFRGLP